MNEELPAKWVSFYMNEAVHASTMSKDPSTQCGCAIARPDSTLSSLGYNGFPSKIPDWHELLADRELKNQLVLHAEMNAFDNSRDNSFVGFHLFVYPLPPCVRCMVSIISKGVTHVYAAKPNEHRRLRWGKSLEMSETAAYLAGVKLKILEQDEQGIWK